jgi:hypothetical protein
VNPKKSKTLREFSTFGEFMHEQVAARVRLRKLAKAARVKLRAKKSASWAAHKGLAAKSKIANTIISAKLRVDIAASDVATAAMCDRDVLAENHARTHRKYTCQNPWCEKKFSALSPTHGVRLWCSNKCRTAGNRLQKSFGFASRNS